MPDEIHIRRAAIKYTQPKDNHLRNELHRLRPSARVHLIIFGSSLLPTPRQRPVVRIQVQQGTVQVRGIRQPDDVGHQQPAGWPIDAVEQGRCGDGQRIDGDDQAERLVGGDGVNGKQVI